MKERLEDKREDRINRYILPIETKIEEAKEQIRELYKSQGINV